MKANITIPMTFPVEQSQIIYPMSMLHEFLSDEQIMRYGRDYGFDPEDTHFHFDLDSGMLESTDHGLTEWHNHGLPVEDRDFFYEDLGDEDKARFAPESVNSKRI